MPDDMVAPTPAPMSYGREMAGVHAQGKSVTTTVELMAGSGLKYVHATNKGRKGVEGDLEKSRMKVPIIIILLFIASSDCGWMIVVVETRFREQRKFRRRRNGFVLS